MSNVSKNSRLPGMNEQSISDRLIRLPIAQVSVTVVIITHIVGVFGFLSDWRDLFLTLTPLHLLITFILLVINHGHLKNIFIVFASIVIVVSFIVEYLGVNSGLIFGEYEYGEALGLKIGNTPVMIGILWFILIYSIGIMINKWSSSILIKSLIGATFMVLIDIFIEPVATELGFWNWLQDVIPIQNYFAWFVVSLIFFILFFLLPFKRKNPVASTVYLTQLLFFISITLLSRLQ